MKTTLLKVENNDIPGSIKKFLGTLLENKVVDAVLVPKMLPSGDGFVQGLISDADKLDNINPFAPTMAVQSAAILSKLTTGPHTGKIAVVLKPCELKAAVELVKFLQVNLDNVITVGVDCAGTYEVDVYKEMIQGSKQAPLEEFLKAAAGGDITPVDGYEMRQSCQICGDPVPVSPDILIGFYGQDPSKDLLLSIGSRFEKDLAEKLSLSLSDGDTAQRDKIVENIKSAKNKKKAGVLEELKTRTDSIEKLLGVLSTCIRCHNCMNACPICYCKECVFQSAVFEHKPDQILNLAKRSGVIRMPGDNLIFHLTRMSHMATSCVSCGMCESACPANLPVSSLFSSIGSELQALFDYVPGRDAGDVPPVSTFKEEELE